MAEINIPRTWIAQEPLHAIIRFGNETQRDANGAALVGALAGLDLGAHDRKILEWLSGYESSTVATVCSWLERARAAGAAEAHGEVPDGR